MTTIHMRIIQGHELIADLPEWNGPIPRTGDYVLHPAASAGRPRGYRGVRQVRQVAYS